MFFDPLQILMVAPALLLAWWAQMRVKSAYAAGMQSPSRWSGADTARRILDEAGLHDVPVEETPGMLSDHYDPRDRVVRLSSEVYRMRSLAAVGIAAHEVGHALQHARGYAPLALRNMAVPAAVWGPNLSMGLLMVGLFLAGSQPFLGQQIIWLGIFIFGGVVAFQMLTLPVEFDASNRAKRILAETGMVDAQGGAVVSRVLNAAAWTYVAASLQSVLTLLYFVVRFGGAGRSSDDR